MNELAVTIATNPVLQAIAIAVAMGTLLGTIWKSARWAIPVLTALISGGVARARWRVRRPIVRRARTDCRDPILFGTRLTSDFILILLISIGLIITTNFAVASVSEEMDKVLFGKPFSKEFYLLSKLSMQFFSFFFLFLFFLRLGRLLIYVRLVRRYRIRGILAWRRRQLHEEVQ